MICFGVTHFGLVKYDKMKIKFKKSLQTHSKKNGPKIYIFWTSETLTTLSNQWTSCNSVVMHSNFYSHIVLSSLFPHSRPDVEKIISKRCLYPVHEEKHIALHNFFAFSSNSIFCEPIAKEIVLLGKGLGEQLIIKDTTPQMLWPKNQYLDCKISLTAVQWS